MDTGRSRLTWKSNAGLPPRQAEVSGMIARIPNVGYRGFDKRMGMLD
jgi:hypothetical protein